MSVRLTGEGLHTIVAQDDPANSTSSPVVFTLDTATPTGGTPVLAAAWDSGTSHTDGITGVTAPTFTVALGSTVVAGDRVQLLLGGSGAEPAAIERSRSTSAGEGSKPVCSRRYSRKS